jgi:hypothetical protein
MASLQGTRRYSVEELQVLRGWLRPGVSGPEGARSREKYRESLPCNNLYRKGLLFSGAFQVRRGFSQAAVH